MKEFKVNEYITLKLEDGNTSIYVKEKLFNQCKYLLLDIPVEDIDTVDDINSIDEAAEKLGWTEQRQVGVEGYLIDPETEFWGHCSNIQAWAENNYDTRLLHSNLSFPLLRRLMKAGDAKANRVFKEEIVKRFVQGNEMVQTYLVKEKYLTYLGSDELKILVTELIEREDFNSLELSVISGVRPFRLTKDQVITLLFDSNCPQTIREFFCNEGYIDILTKEERTVLFNIPLFVKSLYNIVSEGEGSKYKEKVKEKELQDLMRDAIRKKRDQI